ncbi:proteasome subunit beta type-4 [Drosophila nasuta]|uniref:Proteasome subunit beta n=1 Tax=Drosophila albomicans TaxID=7291 RepID=A0A6P8XVC3_DROAB|nr:proteasome subunit beta type-4 [Drosophila albomicans]XP_060646356.1 proteasome subunit beta type-4 [Drosophila nasuta]
MMNNSFAQPMWQNGPAPGQFYNFIGGGYNNGAPAQLPRELTTCGPYGTKHSTAAITTGSSVLGIKFDGGVLVAADTLVSYGSLARYQNIDRVFKINDKILIGGSGDFADIQSIMRNIEQKMIEDQCCNDGVVMKPKAMATWMTRVLYNRRSRMNPLYIDVVVGGIDEGGAPYLGSVDLRGRAYDDYVVATGFARHLALPLVRERKPKDRDFTFEEATNLIREAMKVLYYRDTRSMPRYTVGICTAANCSIKGPFKVEENWTFAETVKGY